mgnify:CR=1 FL=1
MGGNFYPPAHLRVNTRTPCNITKTIVGNNYIVIYSHIFNEIYLYFIKEKKVNPLFSLSFDVYFWLNLRDVRN